MRQSPWRALLPTRGRAVWESMVTALYMGKTACTFLQLRLDSADVIQRQFCPHDPSTYTS